MKLKNMIVESGLSKIWEHMYAHDCGTISAFRYATDCGKGEKYTKKQNLQRNASLLSKLLTKGYSVTAIKGAYIERYKSDESTEVNENSFFVCDIDDKGDLFKTLRYLGEFFEQDSVVLIPKGAEYSELMGTNKCANAYPGYKNVIRYDKKEFGKEGAEFFSRIKNRPFRFFTDVIAEEVVAPKEIIGKMACSITSKMKWQDVPLREYDTIF